MKTRRRDDSKQKKTRYHRERFRRYLNNSLLFYRAARRNTFNPGQFLTLTVAHLRVDTVAGRVVTFAIRAVNLPARILPETFIFLSVSHRNTNASACN